MYSTRRFATIARSPARPVRDRVKPFKTMTPPLTLTTAMQMLPLLAATSVEHRRPQCLLTLARSLEIPPRISSFFVCARVLFAY